MSESTLTFPFVDLRSRLRPERLERLARRNGQTEQTSARRSIIEEVAGWLWRAQEATGDGCVAQFYHLQTGWLSVDGETTGAAVNTMLALAEILPDRDLIERAIRLGKASMKHDEMGGRSLPKIVNSEDIAAAARAVLGWTALYEQTNDPEFKNEAVTAGKRLVRFQENGLMDHPVTVPHKSIAAWALWRLFCLHPNKTFRITADSLGNSVAGNSTPEGYLRGCIGANGADPSLIHIAQALHGLLEAGLLSGYRSWIVAAHRGAQRLFEFHRQKGTLAGRYGPDWRPDHSFNCMAGCAQTALLWLRLYQYGWPDTYFNAATQVARFITSTIDTANPDPGIRGGIRAGYPLWVDYHPLAYSATAARLALDVFLLEKKLSPTGKRYRRLQIRRPAEGGYPEGGIR
ncbi:hypothetical protein ACFLQW_01060 [Candidatus Zixiibacteriota bacterium]